MTARELLARLEADDVRLSIQGDRLVLDAPTGVLSQAWIEELRPHKTELVAILSERRSESASAEGPERESFEEIIEAARRFQRDGRPGPWEAFTMSAEALDGWWTSARMSRAPSTWLVTGRLVWSYRRSRQ